MFPKETLQGFPGIQLSDVKHAETLFHCAINIFKLENSILKPYQMSTLTQYPVLNLLLNVNHFYVILNVEKVNKNIYCSICGHYFTRTQRKKTHKCNVTNHFFPGGVFNVKLNIHQKLNNFSLKLKDKYFPHIIIFDFESITDRNITKSRLNTKTTGRHVPISVSVASNINKINTKFFFTNGDSYDLIQRFMDYINLLAVESYDILLSKNNTLIQQLECLENQYKVNSVDGILNPYTILLKDVHFYLKKPRF